MPRHVPHRDTWPPRPCAHSHALHLLERHHTLKPHTRPGFASKNLKGLGQFRFAQVQTRTKLTLNQGYAEHLLAVRGTPQRTQQLLDGKGVASFPMQAGRSPVCLCRANAPRPWRRLSVLMFFHVGPLQPLDRFTSAYTPPRGGAALLLFLPKTRIFDGFLPKNTASTDSHSRRSLRSLLECSCFAFLVARYRSLLEMR